ncbi:hypothetical protein QAD02_001726 [Eretmocerus hayati]|uniref:Uncharacterized protein n=1 Tax=Eretmocerus hayati TaxID=131215 RepID=A0ACC2NJR2_9HYME|nr:hypothetical protein QAD02_001726 [Eretmocerus hayati]
MDGLDSDDLREKELLDIDEISDHAPTDSSKRNIDEYLELYTPNESLPALLKDKGAKTGLFVGYVDQIVKPAPAHGSKVMHIVLNNGKNIRMQVTAWGETFIEKLNTVATMNNVVWAEKLKICEYKAGTNYKYGNQAIYLAVEDISSFDVIGSRAGQDYCATEPASLKEAVPVKFDEIIDSKGLIRVRGYVRIPFRQIKRKRGNSLGGLVTDAKKLLLEINIKADDSNLKNIHKGHQIELIGTLMVNERNSDKHFLSVESIDQVVKISDDKLTLVDIMKGNFLI